MKTKTLNRTIIVILFICGILSIFSIGLFIINFHSQNISEKIEDWAQFGDYLGGILNPILALANICVFVVLTITIQNITDKNNQEGFNVNQKIAMMSMKHEELIHFKKEMDKNLALWHDNLESIENIKTVLYGYNVLEYRMLFLFLELKESKNNGLLRSYIVAALDTYNQGNRIEAAQYHIPVSNTYGMLISDIGKWTVS